MKILLLQAVSKKTSRENKDTNGSYGTVNEFGKGFTAQILSFLKNRTMNFPELLPAYVHAILKAKGHSIRYQINRLDPDVEVVLIQTSITNFKTEIGWATRIKTLYPHIKVGFIGGMVSGNPSYYDGQGDFSIIGEAENTFMKNDLSNLQGRIEAGLVPDLDDLPFPDWSHITDWKTNYGFIRKTKGRSIPMLASRGCPMSCSYYCTYPLVQGNRFRVRSPENIIAEITHLINNYGMTTVLFRDPIFSLKMDRTVELCELIIKKGLKFKWICETHPRLLDKELIALMARAGCITVKLGIESGNIEVMKKSHRAYSDLQKQEEIIKLCENRHIDVLCFFILGLFDDTEKTIHQTIGYAKSLNTFGAQFTIATPYPGTPWFSDLKEQNAVFQLDPELENYNQYRLVFKHPNLTYAEIEELKSQAYQQYYLRWGFIRKNLLKIS